MRLEHCIRRWLGLKSHCVARIEATPEAIVAEIREVPNRRLTEPVEPEPLEGEVVCRQRLGGLLKSYYRQAA